MAIAEDYIVKSKEVHKVDLMQEGNDVVEKPKEKVFDKVKDSGVRHDFGTGAHRDIQFGKGMPHLLPMIAMRRLAKHFENGAVKYGKNNWRKGIPLSSYLDSAFRHWASLIECKEDEDHGASLMWNAACFVETVELIRQGKLPRSLDDIGFIKEEKTQDGDT
jgi:hypothetical protein